MKFFFIILFILLNFSPIFAQKYPHWFLFQDEYPTSVVGYSSISLYPDSSIQSAFKNASINYSMLKGCEVIGSTGSWATELGNYIINGSVTINFDTLSDIFFSSYKIGDSFVSSQIAIVLAVPKNFSGKINNTLVDISCGKQPEWIENSNKENIVVGFDQNHFYYEEDAWKSSTNYAVIRLAKEKFIKITRLGDLNKSNGNFLQESNFINRLKNIKILRRWRNNEKGLFYVLIHGN